jgi:hypothetical protein
MQDSALNAFEVHNFMSEQDILVAFSGQFNHQVINTLLKNIKYKLMSAPSEPAIDQKVYCILVECIENVSKYASRDPDKPKNGIFLLCKNDTEFRVITGNPILNADITPLKEKLETVAALQVPELKQMYRQQLLSERASENSAGLGLIDIAIKSGNKIQFNFRPLTNEMSFYHFQAVITINQ